MNVSVLSTNLSVKYTDYVILITPMAANIVAFHKIYVNVSIWQVPDTYHCDCYYYLGNIVWRDPSIMEREGLS